MFIIIIFLVINQKKTSKKENFALFSSSDDVSTWGGSGNLKVPGNTTIDGALYVKGNISGPSMDHLQNQITNLQNQITDLQNQINDNLAYVRRSYT